MQVPAFKTNGTAEFRIGRPILKYCCYFWSGARINMVEPTGDNRRRAASRADERLLAFLMMHAAPARLFRSPENRYYAQISVGDRDEIRRLDSPAFRDWLIRGCWDHRLETPSEAMIRKVISFLELSARRKRTCAPVFLRVGGNGEDAGSTYFLDLGDASGRAVQIRADGWSVVERPGTQFRRPEGLLALPVPGQNGSIELLRSYVNLSEGHFRRAVVWLAAALLPCGPHPALIIRGDAGSARSTLAKVLKLLIDPDSNLLLTGHDNAGELMATSHDTWLPVYDDVSLMPRWLSKTLSDLVRSRVMATDSIHRGKELSMPLTSRPIILSGIENGNEQFKPSPLCIHLELRSILFDDRRAEDEFWRSFQADYPRILGGLLDVLVEGLRLVRADRRSA
jgi:hypothetical protein